eukprot:scaffold57683_cov20-Tisochrysis_lutea.AAC.1
MVGLVAVQGDTGANGSVSAPHHPSLLISSGPNLDEAQTPIIKFVGSARRGGVTDPVLGGSRFKTLLNLFNRTIPRTSYAVLVRDYRVTLLY